MILDLLSLAQELAEKRGPGRPRSIELRRAVSTAYYALFHALARLCAAELVGKRKPWAVVAPLYRSIEHRRAREILNDVRRKEPASSLSSIAVAFSQLQDARHLADYDPAPFPYRRGETIDFVDTARQAVLQLGRLDDQSKLMLAIRLIARSR